MIVWAWALVLAITAGAVGWTVVLHLREDWQGASAVLWCLASFWWVLVAVLSITVV